MSPLGWIAGLFLPACAATGAQGLPQPSVIDFAHLERPASPNTALAAPEGFQPHPDIITHPYTVSAPELFSAVEQVAAREPRTYPAATYAPQLQLHWVVRSAVFNFPDLVTAQVTSRGEHESALILYSRSVYGRSDFGVNRKRVLSWLAALDGVLSPSSER
jgi:uncharacterized protein (DUF1499 family)